jgi:hypothetical protein
MVKKRTASRGKKPAKRAHWSEKLTRIGACSDAVTWARKQPSYAKAWMSCKRADWLLWLAGRLCKNEGTRKTIVLAACACARTALVHVPAGETRPLNAIETTEAWCRGEATLEQVRKARRAAYAATAAAYAADAAAADAADAAAYAADAADAAAYAADAAAAAAAAARTRVYAHMAPPVRKCVKRPVLP